MAEIAPFRALRYDLDRVDASAVLAPPPSAIDDDTRAALAARDPHNCAHLIRPLPRHPAPGDDSGNAPGDAYRSAADTLAAWRQSGVLIRDQRPAIYRYHQAFQTRELGEQRVIRRGFIAAVRLHPFADRIVLPTRRTREGRVADQLALMEATGAHLSPVFALYGDPSGETDRIFSRIEGRAPNLDGTTDDGTRHRLWRVDDREILGRLTRVLAPLKLYIADGHHRYQAMLALRERMYERAGGLSMGSAAQFGTLFLANVNDPGLISLPTHRVVVDVDGFDPEALMRDAEAFFDVTTVDQGAVNAERLRAALSEASAKRPSFAAVWPFADDAALLSLKPAVVPADVLDDPPAVANLDVSLLHGLIFERLLGLEPNPDADPNAAAQSPAGHIRYVYDVNQALQQIADVDGQICFVMSATRIEQMRAVCDGGHVMPEHSLRLPPPLASGVLLNLVDPDEEL